MANESDLHHNLHSLLLVIGLAVTSFGLLIMGQAIPNEQTSTSSSPEPLQSVGSHANGEGEVPAPALGQSGENDVLIAETVPSSNRLPKERFSGEGVGRKSLLATSRDDKRVFLLEATATLRNLAHGGCELSARPLGGTTRRCASATEKMLVAVPPDIGD
jgi:hypothetical protein